MGPSPANMLHYALFDLDDTLYPSQCGLWAALGQRIDLYLVDRLGLAHEACGPLRRHYLATFGTTLNGLRQEHGIDPHDYLAFVHDLPLDDYLSPHPELDQMLARLPLTKVIFTNADAAHAQRVLDRLGIARHFTAMFDIHALSLINKPDTRAYHHVLAELAVPASACVFVDDRPDNLAPAHALGMRTVLVTSSPGAPLPGVDHQIASILELERVLPLAPGDAVAGKGVVPAAPPARRAREAEG